MPEIICGRSHSRRESLLFERIKNAAQQGKALVIVPDQYSFELDKRLYEYLGAALFNSIETAGITALCEKICRSLGGSGLENADNDTKLIAMYRAQSRLRAEGGLRLYKRSLLRPTFVTDCITLISQLIRAGATPETLRIASENSPLGSAKLYDLSMIYEAFARSLKELGCRGILTQTAQAAALSREHDYFSGRTIFFEGFTSFSSDELSLAESVISSSVMTVFGLILDEHLPKGANPFAETIRTKSRIERISADCGKTVKITRADGSSQSAPLAHINENLNAYKCDKLDSRGLVKVAAADDIYQECEYVCAEICRLVRDEGARYSETAVICGGFDASAQILAAAAERYGIPYFTDKSVSALTSVPAKYLISVLDSVLTREYRTENILRIVKSPLSAFFDYDACDLEDFCIKWRVEGDMWKKPFRVGGEEERSDRIDETRKRIIEPLERFRGAVKDAATGEICEALFTLLDELEMSKQIYSAVRAASASEETTETEVSRSFKQVWLGIVGAVRRIYETMRDEKISLRSFAELLRLMLDGISISAPPQKSDCVRIAEAGRSRISGVKTLFIIQANDGIFPSGISSSGLFRGAELKALSELGTELESEPRIQLDAERMSVYTAVTAPTERLYVSYSESDRTGAPAIASQLTQTIRNMFADDIFVRISSLPQEFFCTSYRTAFYKYLEHSKDNTRETVSIGESLKGSPEYAARLDFVRDAAAARDEAISEKTARALFFPSDMNLSATRVSDYYKCPFSYFCRHGLKLYAPQAVDIDPRYVGNIAHLCLERVMSREENGKRVYNERFTAMTEDELFALISKVTDEYVRDEMGGEYGKTLGFKFALERLKRSALSMAVNFRDEMRSSLFLPAAFEYDLTDSDGNSVLAISLGDIKINLRGLIDRVDIYRTENGTWLRIVDYKTGRQTFKEEEVYHGLDLQMLIYLLAVTHAAGGDVKPAGIMYSHIRFVPPTLTLSEVTELEESGGLEERIRLECAKNYKPDGVMLGDEIIPALNTDHNGVYTIFTFKKDGEVRGDSPSQPISEERLKAMELFALEKVKEMAMRLKRGDIKADPIETSAGLPCVYCEYKTMCKNADPKNPRAVSQEDGLRLDEQLKKLIGEEQTEVRS